MDIRLEKPFEKSIEIEAISSKSFVHRLLIAAALDGSKRKIITNIFSEDMKATMNCLNALGADVRMEEDGFVIYAGVSFCENAVLDCNESGSTARFIMPLSAVFCKSAKLIGRGKLPKRPNEALCRELRKNGADIDSDFLPTTVSGVLKSGEYTLPGNVSSQFITGLLIALPLIDGDSILNIDGKLESAGYVDITCEVLKQFGIRIKRNENKFIIPGNQKYFCKTEGNIIAEGDWSNSAYVLGMGALGADVLIKGLNVYSTQPDMACLELIKNFGAKLEIEKVTDKLSNIRVKRAELHGITVDVSQIPDLVPALAVIASFADSDSVFLNVNRLRIKESDRVESIMRLLSSYGIGCETKIDGESEQLIVHSGNIDVSDWDVDSYNDHRIVMAATMAFIGRNINADDFAAMMIKRADAVNKSYPDFFNIMELV